MRTLTNTVELGKLRRSEGVVRATVSVWDMYICSFTQKWFLGSITERRYTSRKEI